MAKAEKITRTVEELQTRIVKKDVPDGLVMHLTHEEARTLAEILASVGGDSRNSARRYSQSVCDALRRAGYGFTRRPFWATKGEQDAFFISGSIYFRGELPAAAGEQFL